MQCVLQNLEQLIISCIHSEENTLSIATDGPYVLVTTAIWSPLYSLGQLDSIGLAFHGTLDDTYVFRMIDIEPIATRKG